jgi:hypothetical protein
LSYETFLDFNDLSTAVHSSDFAQDELDEAFQFDQSFLDNHNFQEVLSERTFEDPVFEEPPVRWSK